MKIIHCADIHLDARMETNFDKDKASQRRRELMLTFERLVTFANQNSVDAIIIAGDMFDCSRVSRKTRERIFNLIKANSHLDFLYLPGNHDEENLLSDLEEKIENLKIFTDHWTSFCYNGVVISGRVNNKDKTFYDSLILDENKFNIVVLHGPITKYNVKEDGQEISLAKLKNKNIDYLALGHIHQFESGQIDQRGEYCYSGCLEGRGFDECGKKGFVLLNIEGSNFDFQFVPFASREFIEVTVDITGKDDWFEIENEVKEKLKIAQKKDIVSLTLVGKFSLSLNKQTDMLADLLNSMFFLAKIKDNSTLSVDIKDFEFDMSLKGEFVREVVCSNLTDKEKEDVLIIGLKALGGEEI